MGASTEAIRIAKIAGQAASDKHGFDILAIDVASKLAITDIFLIVSAKNERQVSAIVNGIDEELHKHGVKSSRREGDREARWVLVDFVDIVVHVMHVEERMTYSLERLWRDCDVIELDLVDPEPTPVTFDD